MFHLKSTPMVLVVVLILQSLQGEEIESFEFSDFSDLSSFTLLGITASIHQFGPIFYDNQAVLRLTYNLWQVGGAFLVFPLLLKAGNDEVSFTAYFQFQITDPCGITDSADGIQGADGLALVLAGQNNILGGVGGGLGYMNMPESVAIEIDTWHNTGNPAVDPPNDGNHIGIDLGGSVNSVITKKISTPLNNGNIWHVWVDYSGMAYTLDVFVSKAPEKPRESSLSYPVRLSSIVSDQMYMGFTAGTGAACNDHDIRYWSYSSWTSPKNLAPRIFHGIITSIQKGKEIPFSFQVIDDTGELSSIAVFFRLQGQTEYDKIDVVPNPPQTSTHYDVGLSGLTDTLTPVEYYIQATDRGGLSGFHGTAEDPHVITIIDPCLNISDTNDSDNDGRSDRQECYDGTDPNTPQAPPVKPPGNRTLLGNINPEYPTIVLTHGLQPKKQDVEDLWTGTGEKQAANLIHSALGERADKINIVQYVWEEGFQGIPTEGSYTRARNSTQDSGLRLAHELLRALGSDYQHSIHFIGHSLGSIVNTYACDALLKELPDVHLAQFTILDYPNHVGRIPPFTLQEESSGYNANFFAFNLPISKPGLDLKIDNYYSDPKVLFSAGVGDVVNGPVHNHDPLVNPNDMDDLIFNEGFDNDHSGVHQWYRWTIDPNGLRENSCIGVDESVFNRPLFFPLIDESLNPCHRGWYWSIFGPAPEDFPKNNGTPLNMCVESPLQLIESREYGCKITVEDQVTRIQCGEASSPFAVLTVDIPKNASFLTFGYQFINSSDGDYTSALLDNTVVWMVSGESVDAGVPLFSGNIPIHGFSGRQNMIVALHGVGEPNFGFIIDNIQIGSLIALFIRGDSNIDRKVDISDTINILNWLFLGTGTMPCEDAGDANDSGKIDISDAIYILGFLFLGTPLALPAPYPQVGSDPTEDMLECEGY